MAKPYGVDGMIGVIDALNSRIERSLLSGGTFTNSVNVTSEPLTIDDIVEAFNAQRKTAFLMRIWLVDRPDGFNLIRSVFPESGKFTLPSPIMGVPVMQFNRIAFDDEKEIIAKPDEDLIELRARNRGKVVWPHWCATSGIYLEMSDGSARTLRAAHERLPEVK